MLLMQVTLSPNSCRKYRVDNGRSAQAQDSIKKAWWQDCQLGTAKK